MQETASYCVGLLCLVEHGSGRTSVCRVALPALHARPGDVCQSTRRERAVASPFPRRVNTDHNSN